MPDYRIHYAGDEGGIVCKLDFGKESEQNVFSPRSHTWLDGNFLHEAAQTTYDFISSAIVAFYVADNLLYFL